jgi:hypothetical protein
MAGASTGSTFHTTDGSLIDYTVVGPNNTFQPTARFPNGTVVAYGACSNNACYATTITDANGNFISISYVGNAGPRIEHIQDSIGRVIWFNYDSSNRLVSIIAPGLQGSIRTVVRLHYAPQTLYCVFDQTIIAPKGPIYVIDGVYFPGTSTGYWFGDPDSYSPCGMILKVSQRRGMTLTASSLSDQGTLTSGTMSRERGYDYSVTFPLPGPPTYAKMTETWAGMDVPPAVTTYAVNSNASPQTVDTVYPDGTRVRQIIGPDGPFCLDALLCSQLTYDPSGNLLQEIDNQWLIEDYDSPLVTSVKVTDKLGQTRTTLYHYLRDMIGGDQPPTNQLNDITQLDYDGKTILRTTWFTNEADSHYFDRHIFNLPVSVKIGSYQNSQLQVVSRTDYVYDDQPLVNTPGVVGYADPGTPYRGNVTQITRYKNTSSNPLSVTESRRYDVTGNLVEVSGSCCVETKFTYTPATQFTYPEQITLGDTGSADAHVSQSVTYDFSTGLPLTRTDANGLTSTLSYDNASLRLRTQTLPAAGTTVSLSSGYVQYAFDDSALSLTQSSYISNIPRVGGCFPPPCQPILEAQSITQFNGLGLVQRAQNQGRRQHLERRL